MEFQDVQQFIDQNKDSNPELQAYLQGFQQPLTVEGMQKFVDENDDAKKWLDSVKDKHFSKGLETWRSNNLQKLIDEEVKKRYPDEDPKDKAVKELQLQIEQMQQEKQFESLKNKALTEVQSNKLPFTSLVDMFIGQDEDSTLNNINRLKEVWDQSVKDAVEERIKSSGYTPPKDNTGSGLTFEQLKGMSPKEIQKLDWAEVQKVLNQNK